MNGKRLKKLEIKKPSPIKLAMEDELIRNAVGRQPSHMLALESRIMLDAALVSVLAEGAEAAPDGLAGTPESNDAQFVEPPATQGAQASADPSQTENTEPRQEIIFVDSAVSDYSKLIEGIDPDVEIYILDGNSDGVEQIASTLQQLQSEENFQGFDAIHIVSHGSEAQLILGSTTLTLNSMQNGHADELAIIGDSLSENADILIYGCNFGANIEGQEAAELLRSLTGADIAASTDDTGHESFGGDWELLCLFNF